MTKELQTRRFLISGSVQGVGYRYFAQRAAQRLGVVGYVRNLIDGRVEAIAAGTAPQLAALRAELEHGPRFATVSDVAEETAEPLPATVHSFTVDPA
ncbi:MAG: acylphosphatase [Acidobacteria bacterium]|nr:acylphosphatase [Acidobacteriota bacterium]